MIECRKNLARSSPQGCELLGRGTRIQRERIMASQFGTLFRVSTFGESHGTAVGCVVDGCPAGVSIPLSSVQAFLSKRRPGQSEFTTPRKETDTAVILSGIHSSGLSLGSPICIAVYNENQRSQDYSDIAQVFRPSHADFTTFAKYGLREAAGGARSSARETIGRVAAAAVAKCLLEKHFPNIAVVAWVQRIQGIEANVNPESVTDAEVESSPIRCPDKNSAVEMEKAILSAKEAGDTLGGLIRCIVRNPPVGLGEPVFDKLEADLAKAMLSLPATKSFEIGSGLEGTFQNGSAHNDPFYLTEKGEVRTTTNNSGGVQGGISNGMPLDIRVGFKPVSTLFLAQQTLKVEGGALEETEFQPKAGRHDSCVLPRAVPMVEAMVWLVLADHFLRQRALVGSFP